MVGCLLPYITWRTSEQSGMLKTDMFSFLQKLEGTVLRSFCTCWVFLCSLVVCCVCCVTCFITQLLAQFLILKVQQQYFQLCVWVSFWVFYWNPLLYMPVFVPVWGCFYCYASILWFEILCETSLALLFLSRIALTNSVSIRCCVNGKVIWEVSGGPWD